MVTFSSRNTNIYKIWKLSKAIFSVFYNISPPNFAVLLILRCSFFLPSSTLSLLCKLCTFKCGRQFVNSCGRQFGRHGYCDTLLWQLPLLKLWRKHGTPTSMCIQRFKHQIIFIWYMSAFLPLHGAQRQCKSNESIEMENDQGYDYYAREISSLYVFYRTKITFIEISNKMSQNNESMLS